MLPRCGSLVVLHMLLCMLGFVGCLGLPLKSPAKIIFSILGILCMFCCSSLYNSSVFCSFPSTGTYTSTIVYCLCSTFILVIYGKLIKWIVFTNWVITNTDSSKLLEFFLVLHSFTFNQNVGTRRYIWEPNDAVLCIRVEERSNWGMRTWCRWTSLCCSLNVELG